MLSAAELWDAALAAFDLPDHPSARLTEAARGALGQIWRLELDGRSLALKQLFEPAVEGVVSQEVAYTTRLAAQGLRVAQSLPDRQGRFVSPAAGQWLRLSTWIDGGPPDLGDSRVAGWLGEVLGTMHAAAPSLASELDGAPLDEWYYLPPATESWEPLIARTSPRWAGQLAVRMPLIEQLSVIPRPPGPNTVLCHRDLHPDNVLVTGDAAFVVLDWDNLGPAVPERELAHVLIGWFADRNGVAVTDVRAMVRAYRATGGIATLTDIADFSMALAVRLNFLHLQLTIAADAQSSDRDREWAAREIDEALSLLPTMDVLDAVLAAAV